MDLSKIRNIREDVKKAQQQVKAVHNCKICQAHLQAIKEHQAQAHQETKDVYLG